MAFGVSGSGQMREWRQRALNAPSATRTEVLSGETVVQLEDHDVSEDDDGWVPLSSGPERSYGHSTTIVGLRAAGC